MCGAVAPHVSYSHSDDSHGDQGRLHAIGIAGSRSSVACSSYFLHLLIRIQLPFSYINSPHYLPRAKNHPLLPSSSSQHAHDVYGLIRPRARRLLFTCMIITESSTQPVNFTISQAASQLTQHSSPSLVRRYTSATVALRKNHRPFPL